MAGDSPARIKLTYEDYLEIPNDGKRHEIIDGEHFVNPSPSLYHQRISGAINAQLRRQIQDAGRGEVFFAPLDVQLSDVDVVEPDLIVVLNENLDILTESHIVGPPDLVVEILSPSSVRLDRHIKRKCYEKFRIPEYWIVDPEAHEVEQHCLEGDRYALRGTHTERIESGAIPDVVIDLTTVW